MKTSKKLKLHEYTALLRDKKQLEIAQTLLDAQIMKFEADECFQKQTKKTKTNAIQEQMKDTKSLKQVKLEFFAQKTPERIISAVLDQIITAAWKVIKPNDMSSEMKSQVFPSPMRVKVAYSAVLKKKILTYMQEHSLAHTYLYFQRKIPRSTLFNWRKGEANGTRKKKQGRKTPFAILEEELFGWFLKKRIQKICLSQNLLINKALKLAKTILTDPDITLTAQEREAYIKFEGSNGWIDNFKKIQPCCKSSYN